ncbi:MAG: lysophospholipid acyltransferase family protein [Bacillota bacterium]|nr:lysophospholipid acyltransferase family protein [Bacillota bacterium]
MAAETAYRVLKPLVGAALWLRYRSRVYGRENVPPEGPVILAGNHISAADPVLIAVICPRPVHFFAKQELLRYPLVAQAINAFAIPVDRGRGDLNAMRRALRVLRDGGVLGVHYEGTRSRSGVPLRPRGGVGFLVEHTGAPVVPMAVEGTNQPLPSRAWVWFGRPLRFSREEAADHQRVAEQVAAEVEWMRRRLRRLAGIDEPTGGVLPG